MQVVLGLHPFIQQPFKVTTKCFSYSWKKWLTTSLQSSGHLSTLMIMWSKSGPPVFTCPLVAPSTDPWHSPPCPLAPACSSDQLACLGLPYPTSLFPSNNPPNPGVMMATETTGTAAAKWGGHVTSLYGRKSSPNSIVSQRLLVRTLGIFLYFPLMLYQTYLELTYPTRIDILDVFDIALGSLFRFIQLLMKPKKGHK